MNVLPIERKGLLNNSFHARQEMTYILTSNCAYKKFTVKFTHVGFKHV